MDPRIDKLAEVMVCYSLELKAGDWVRISGHPQALPLIKAFYRRALAAGAHPYYQAVVDDLEEILFKHGTAEQLRFIPETARLETEKLDALFHIFGETNTKYLSNTDPRQQALYRAARFDLHRRFLERSASGGLRWTGTLFPVVSAAQDAEMSLDEYEKFVYAAGHLDDEDPVAFWRNLSGRQEKLCRFLDGVKEIRLHGRETDLVLRTEGRRWINCDGHMNFPDGEIFTSPLENSAEGHILFSFPACYGGREVADVRLEFRQGRVTRCTAGKNEEFIHRMLAMDEGASRIGEFAIGTNDRITRFSKNILFDEKIGGTVHLALGASLKETGGGNESALHWDMVCDLRGGGEILADGRPVHRDGRFLIDLE